MRLLQPERLCSPQDSDVEWSPNPPPPIAMVFGSEGFGRQLDLDEL